MIISSPVRLGKRPLIGALGFCAALMASAAFADDKVLATVDGDPITQDDLNVALEDIGSGLPQGMEGPARDKYVLDYLIDMKLVAKKAAADKLDDSADFARRAAYSRQKILMEALLGNVAKTADTDEAEHKVYDEAAKAQPPEPEIHARHILVATEDDAKAALARVKGGEDFAKVATELSKDPGSEGGDLGWFTKDKMVPEFAEAAFKLEPGQVSDPVKSQFGWHIIKVEEKRMKTFPPFDQVKEQAARYVAQKAQSELIGELRKSAKIERMAAADKPADAGKPADPAATGTAPGDAKKP
ncbi:MAG TPA: peptidylprolyl isomerase [Roseiarcus sp.]|nr:peptidylprolyl isomerase [Roseiarcus sp.]